MFSPYLGIHAARGGGVSQWTSEHNLLVQFLTVYRSKIEVSKKFFDIVATHNDHPSHAKHVLGSIYVFFHPLWGLCAQGRVSAKWTAGPSRTGRRRSTTRYTPF